MNTEIPEPAQSTPSRQIAEWCETEFRRFAPGTVSSKAPVFFLPLPPPPPIQETDALDDSELEEISGGKRFKWEYMSSRAMTTFVEALWRGDGFFSALEQAFDPNLKGNSIAKKLHGLSKSGLPRI